MLLQRFMALRQPLLVVPDAAACTRWEMQWLAAGDGHRAWLRPPVMSVDRALDEIALREAIQLGPI